jgi:hypothetical protein
MAPLNALLAAKLRAGLGNPNPCGVPGRGERLAAFPRKFGQSEDGRRVSTPRHSISRSARNSNDCGIVSSIAFAFFALISDSNFAGYHLVEKKNAATTDATVR